MISRYRVGDIEVLVGRYRGRGGEEVEEEGRRYRGRGGRRSRKRAGDIEV